MNKFAKCSKCKKNMLEKKDYRNGLISFCHYCNGFFDKEGKFIGEGSVYWNTKYKSGYWSDMLIKTAIAGIIVTIFSAQLDKPAYLYFILLIPIGYVISYLILKKEHFFVG